MKEYTVYVTQKKNLPDPEAAGLERTLSSLRPGKKIRAGIYMVYKIKTSAGAEKVRKICDRLLSDPVTQECYIVCAGSNMRNERLPRAKALVPQGFPSVAMTFIERLPRAKALVPQGLPSVAMTFLKIAPTWNQGSRRLQPAPNLMKTGGGKIRMIDVFLKKGVTDPAGETVLLGIRDLGIRDRFYIATGKRYSLSGATKKEALNIAGKFLANPVINEFNVS